MAKTTNQPTTADVAAYLQTVEPEARREDAIALNALFQRVTGWTPVMWGPSMVGYGSYHYRYESGREGDFLATGFGARKSNLSIYILPGYADYSPILDRLGQHKTGKSCLYVNRLSDVDLDVLAELIQAGLDDLGRQWPVRPS